jgi:hypothetical protein
MATAKKVSTYKIVLELSEKEAEVLKSMVGNVLGSGEIRNIISNIYFSLHNCGINAIKDLFTDVFKIREEN